jgi:hypothetical protein
MAGDVMIILAESKPSANSGMLVSANMLKSAGLYTLLLSISGSFAIVSVFASFSYRIAEIVFVFRSTGVELPMIKYRPVLLTRLVLVAAVALYKPGNYYG